MTLIKCNYRLALSDIALRYYSGVAPERLDLDRKPTQLLSLRELAGGQALLPPGVLRHVRHDGEGPHHEVEPDQQGGGVPLHLPVPMPGRVIQLKHRHRQNLL